MKKKIFATVLCMVTAVSMLTGCGGTSSDTPKDSEPVMESEAVQTTDEATDNTTVSDTDTESESEAEDTTPEVSAEEAIDTTKMVAILQHYDGYDIDVKDADGNTLYSVTKVPSEISDSIAMNGLNGIEWSVEYVDVEGEQWFQVTWTLPEYMSNGVQFSEHEDPFILTYSPDCNKVMYKEVVYTVPEQ